MKYKASCTATIYGNKNDWSLSPGGNGIEHIGIDVKLEIIGDDKIGYNLCMSPTGFFTADSWHENIKQAMRSARELFSVNEANWRIDGPPNKSMHRST